MAISHILNEEAGARKAVNSFFNTAKDWIKANNGNPDVKTNDDVLNGLMHMYNDRYTKSTSELTNPENLTPDRISRILGIPKGDGEFSPEAYQKVTDERLNYWHEAIERGNIENDRRIAAYFNEPFDAPEESVKTIEHGIEEVEQQVPIPTPKEIADIGANSPSTNIVKAKAPAGPETKETPKEDTVSAVKTEETPSPEPETPVADTSETPVDAGGNWWDFLGTPQFLTVAGVAAAVAAAIRALSRSIKGRFQRYVKMLFRMQRDFNTKETGLDMTSVAGNTGNRFTKWFSPDNWARWIFGDGKVDRATQIGVRPFVRMYQDEIAKDYEQAVKAFNNIALAGKGAKEFSSEGFMSFNEALRNQYLFETVDSSIDSSVNESVLLSTGLSMLAGAAVRSLIKNVTASPGTFTLRTKDKNGEEKLMPIQVTKASTREICLAIIGQFLDKYVNNEAVFRRMGMDVDRLQDISSSSYEKFKKVLEAFRGGRDKYSSNQFQFVQRGWDQMIKNYDDAGQRIIKNFRKYTVHNKNGENRNLSETDANNLEVADMKLKTAWDLGITRLKGFFPSIITAIVSSPEYVTYYDFILEKVLPVFKTGLAGDADYVLDVYPKKGNYYIIRQTSGKPVMSELTNAEEESKKKNLWTRFLDWVDSIQDENVNNSQDDTDKKHEKLKPETFTGAAALVKVLDYNSSSKQIKFRILTAIGGDVIRNKDGKVDVSKMTYETDKNDRIYDFREETLDFNKWSALDPMMVETDALPEDAKYDPNEKEGNPEPNPQPRKRITPVFKKTLTDDKGEEVEEFIFGMDIDDNEGRSIEPAKSYTEDTALYDSAINEANDSSTGPTDSSTDSNTSDSTYQNTSNIKNIIVVKKFPDGTYQINAIVLNNKASFEEFKNALGSDFAEVNDDAITKDIIGQAKNKGYVGKQNLEIEDISKFSESLEQLETQKSNYENATSEVDKIAEQIGNFISNTDELKDFKHLTRWEFIGRDINRAAYFWCKFNSKPAYSATFPLKASSGDASYFFRIWIVAIGAITTQAKDASADASAGNNQPTHQISTFNPRTILMKIYFGNNKNFQINPKQQGAKAIETLMSLPQVEINLAGDNTEKIKEGLTNVLQEAKKNNIITDSIKVSYISDNRMAESNSSSVNILRNIDEGKLKYSHEYFILSETVWNDGKVKNPSKYLKENMKFLVSKTKDEINKILKENVSVQLRPFNKSDRYKVRLPHNRNGLMTSGNTLYESVSIVHFTKRGIIDKVYNIGIKEIKF